MKFALVAGLALSMVVQPVLAQQPATSQAPTSPPNLGLKVEIEPAAMAIVKAMADKLAAANSMSFTKRACALGSR